MRRTNSMRVKWLFVVAALCAAAGVSGVVVPTPVSELAGFGPVSTTSEKLAGNGRGYLAIWIEADRIGGSRLDKQGKPLDPGMRISTIPMSSYAGRCALASDRVDYLVATTAGSQIEVALVSGESGAVTRTFQQSGVEELVQPELIWDGSSYVLSYRRYLNGMVGTELMRFGRDGSVLSSTRSNVGRFDTHLASNGRDIAMFQTGESGATHGTVVARAGGAITLPELESGYPWQIAGVVSDGERYLVVTHLDVSSYGQLFSNDLTPIGERFRIGIPGISSQAVAAPRSHGFVAFVQGPKDAFQVTIDDGPSYPLPILSGAAVEAVAADDPNALVLYHSYLKGTWISSAVLDLGSPRLLASESGTVVSLEPIAPANISIASTGGRFAIAWQASDAATDRIFVRRFDESGKPLASQVLAGEGTTPSLASDGAGGYLVGWLRRPSIYSTQPALAFLAADGTVKTGILDSLPRNVTSIRVVWARDHYVVVWRRNEGVLNSVAVRVSRDGRLIDFEPIAITAGRRDVTGGVFVESDPFVVATGIGIFLAVPTTLYTTTATTTFVDGVLRSFDLDSMRGPERLTWAPATAPLLSANAPLILTFRRGTTVPLCFVRIADDGSLIDDALGRALENGQAPVAATWIHDHWLLAWSDHITLLDANGTRLGAPLPFTSSQTAFAPSPAGAWYARGCRPPEGDVSQLCLGSLTAEAAHTQRRAAH